MFQAVCRAGPALDAVYAPDSNRQVGVSLLHMIVQDQSNMLSKHLLQVQDHMQLTGVTVKEAYVRAWVGG